MDLRKIESESARIVALLERSCKRARIRVTHAEGGRLMVKQSQVAGTDVNAILKRWMRDGAATAHVNRETPRYGDFSSGMDYAEALNAVHEAEREFAALPSAVRAHVRNDPGELLDMVFDPERRGELEKLGLVSVGAAGGAGAEDSGATGAAGELKSSEEPTSSETSSPGGDEGGTSPSGE